MTHGKFHCGGRTHAVSEDVRPVDAEVIEQCHHIGRAVRGRDLPIDVRGTAMTLQFDGDHLMPVDQEGDQVAEAEVDGEHAAVQQHERTPRAVQLVVQMQAVDVGVPATGGGHDRAFLRDLLHSGSLCGSPCWGGHRPYHPVRSTVANGRCQDGTSPGQGGK